MRIEDKLSQMGLTLPEPGPPAGNYVGAVRVGNLLFVSGHGPRSQGQYITGKVGRDLNTEQAYEAAKVVMLNCLASVKRELGDLDRVKRVVKLLGMVNCTEDFTEHPTVINGGVAIAQLIAAPLLVPIHGFVASAGILTTLYVGGTATAAVVFRRLLRSSMQPSTVKDARGRR